MSRQIGAFLLSGRALFAPIGGPFSALFVVATFALVASCNRSMYAVSVAIVIGARGRTLSAGCAPARPLSGPCALGTLDLLVSHAYRVT